MAELITLLLASLTSLLAAGASPEMMAAQVRQNVTEHPPVPLEDVQIAVKPAEEIKTEQGENAPPPGSLQLTFDFKGLFLDPLLFENAQISVGGVKPQPDGKLSISSISFTTHITDDALTAALKADTKELGPNPQVVIEEDGVTLKGSYSAWLTRVPFEVKGNLIVENQTQLVFTIDKSKMAGVPIPGPVNKLIQREVNPVYDLAKFHQRSKKDIDKAKEQLNYEFHLEVQEITPQAGYIIVVGNA